jgi:hypothetical protein
MLKALPPTLLDIADHGLSFGGIASIINDYENPSLAKCRATAAPIPRELPVTIVVRVLLLAMLCPPRV